MTNRHIQKSGAKAGQWVACPAQVSCRNGGEHISDVEMKSMQEWKQKETGDYITQAELTLQDFQDYKDSVIKPVLYSPEQQQKYIVLFDESMKYLYMKKDTERFTMIAQARKINQLARRANYDETKLVPKFNAARDLEDISERIKSVSELTSNLRFLQRDVENQNPFGTAKKRTAEHNKKKYQQKPEINQTVLYSPEKAKANLDAFSVITEYVNLPSGAYDFELDNKKSELHNALKNAELHSEWYELVVAARSDFESKQGIERTFSEFREDVNSQLPLGTTSRKLREKRKASFLAAQQQRAEAVQTIPVEQPQAPKETEMKSFFGNAADKIFNRNLTMKEKK